MLSREEYFKRLDACNSETSLIKGIWNIGWELHVMNDSLTELIDLERLK